MKKDYKKPEAEKITFNYKEQVVAASNGPSRVCCTKVWTNQGDFGCSTGTPESVWSGNATLA